MSTAAKIAEAFTNKKGLYFIVLANAKQFFEFWNEIEELKLSNGSLINEKFKVESTLKRNKSRGFFKPDCSKTCF